MLFDFAKALPNSGPEWGDEFFDEVGNLFGGHADVAFWVIDTIKIEELEVWVFFEAFEEVGAADIELIIIFAAIHRQTPIEDVVPVIRFKQPLPLTVMPPGDAS